MSGTPLNPTEFRDSKVGQAIRTTYGQIIDFMFSRPILTIKQLQEAFDMPYMAAKRSVDKLVDAKVLHETIGYARNRVFQATEIFKALENSE